VLLLTFLSTGTAQADWVRVFDQYLSFDGALAIAVDGSGNVYVTGFATVDHPGYNRDFVTIKYDTNGVQKWVRRYNGPENWHDGAHAIAVDRAGNVYVTGSSAGVGTGLDYATIKYDTNGNRKWVKRYNGPGNKADYANAVAVDGAGNVYVTGSSWNGSSLDYGTIKYEVRF
jgi:hypothetical protein